MAGENYYNHRVRLVSVKDETVRVEFKVTPSFSEGRSVEYSAVTPIHMPGSIQVYKNTASRTFNIGATLISRSPNEADENIQLLQQLRTWTMPYFGSSNTVGDSQKALRDQRKLNPNASYEGETQLSPEEKAAKARERLQQEGIQLLGAPPMVLYLYAYSTTANDQRGPEAFPRVNINRVPVVITNLSFSYPNDVTYFPVSVGGVDGVTTKSESFPTKMDITVDCVETHSPREYERFNLQQFHDGKLVNF
jgi:hypothetical protein